MRHRSTTTAPLLLALLLAAAATSAAACVQTADCDKNISCKGADELCFRKFCKSRCDTTADCAAGEVCVPCNNSCLGGDGNVCVAQTADGKFVCEPVCKEGEVCCLGACVTNCVLQ